MKTIRQGYNLAGYHHPSPVLDSKSSGHGTELEECGCMRDRLMGDADLFSPLELNSRASFNRRFLPMIVELESVKRWTPRWARQHPFIAGEKFTEPRSVSGYEFGTPSPSLASTHPTRSHAHDIPFLHPPLTLNHAYLP